MKILNQLEVERSGEGETLQKTTVSRLQSTSEIDPRSLLHVAQYVPDAQGKEQYESMRITVDAFENKIYESIQNTFKTEYWDTHCSPRELEHTIEGEKKDALIYPEGVSFKELADYLGEYDKDNNKRIWKPDETTFEKDTFVGHINYDFEVLRRYAVKRTGVLEEEISRINDVLTYLDCYFSPRMDTHTTDKENKWVPNIKLDENQEHCQMSIKTGNKISNTWTIPATGNLVIYGWLDSSEALNNRAIPSAFCVIEANIHQLDDESTSTNWQIIAVQPVIPFKTITYVGFNFPVHKGLVIRARTGFTVGAKSGQRSNEQDGFDTLANSTPNGFKCMIFTNTKYQPDKYYDGPGSSPVETYGEQDTHLTIDEVEFNKMDVDELLLGGTPIQDVIDSRISRDREGKEEDKK